MWVIVLIASVAILAAAIPGTWKSFPDALEYDRERLEKIGAHAERDDDCDHENLDILAPPRVGHRRRMDD